MSSILTLCDLLCSSYTLHFITADSKWLGSGGTFGLATDEDEASVRVLREEESASSDPTSSGGDFSPTSKLHESLARQSDILFNLNALDSGFSREVHGKLTVEARWGGRGFLTSQDSNVMINWKDGDGGVKGVRVKKTAVGE